MAQEVIEEERGKLGLGGDIEVLSAGFGLLRNRFKGGKGSSERDD